MKHILITGADSYIGTSFAQYIQTEFPRDYTVHTIDVRDDAWRHADFSGYDAVLHVAGIVHFKETDVECELYYRINRDLTMELAEKAKADGVGQFIFMSTMSVYGKSTGVITRDSLPAPVHHYGISKWQAEQALSKLEDSRFRLCIVRPPMVYGKGCKGNFQQVVRIVQKAPVFPRVHNQRSMIYIENLCVFLRMCVDKELSGVYFPQNREYVNTTTLARAMAHVLHKRRYFSFLLGGLIILGRPLNDVLQRAFGSLIYQDTEDFDFSYCVVDQATSFERSL